MLGPDMGDYAVVTTAESDVKPGAPAGAINGGFFPKTPDGPRLDDPVDPWLAELKDRTVLRSFNSPLDDTVPAKRAITLRDLLTFRLGYGATLKFPPKYPIQKAMDEAGVAPSATWFAGSPDELMKHFGSLPLIHQPGER
jgi:hypothetical protein